MLCGRGALVGYGGRTLRSDKLPRARRRPHGMATLILAGLLWWTTGHVAGQDWTRFRGPNGSGVSPATNLPARWEDTDYLFRVELPGAGHSSPVAWGQRVFLTSAADDGATRIVLCLDAVSGAILWTRTFPASEHSKHQLNSFASPTPCCDTERVYVSWSSPESYLVVALDHQGGELWRADLGPYVSQHSAGPSPIVYQNLLIVGNEQDGESSLVALDRESGQVVWETPRRTEKVSYSTPCVYRPAEGPEELIFLSWAHGVSGIDPRTGGTNWELAGVFDKRTVSSPVLGAGLVFGTCGSGAGGNYLAAVRPAAASGQAPAEVFRIDKSAPYVPTPVVVDNRLYLWSDQGVAGCVELPTGKVLWQKRVGGNYFGSPIWAGGKLYCLSSDGEVAVVAAADEFELLGKMNLGELSHSTPAISGGRLYLRTQSHLFAIGPAGTGR